MSDGDLRLVMARMDIRNEEALRLARCQGLLRSAGLEQRGLLSRTGRWLMCSAGRSLVALGERLERQGRLQPLPPLGDSVSGRR